MAFLVKVALLLSFAFSVVSANSDQVKVDNGDLIAVVQIFRHGQRTPYAFYTNDPYTDRSYWGGLSSGQLTNVGKVQHHELGQYTRARYGGWLPANYSNDDFYAQTTDIDRTHMSAQSNIAGLYPPSDAEKFLPDIPWQPVPVHPMSTAVSGLATCPTLTAQIVATLATEELYLSLDQEYADVYAYLANNSGQAVTSVLGAAAIRDAIYIEEITGKVLPEWTKAIYPNPIELLNQYMWKSYAYSDASKRLRTGVFLNTVVEYFTEMFADPTSNPKYQMYSAHDSNIGPILSTLGYSKLYTPGFASTIYFELRNKSGEAIVNVLHRDTGKNQNIIVRNCTVDCPLASFQSNLSPYLLDSDTFATECATSDATVTTNGEREAELTAQVEDTLHHWKPRKNNNQV